MIVDPDEFWNTMQPNTNEYVTLLHDASKCDWIRGEYVSIDQVLYKTRSITRSVLWLTDQDLEQLKLVKIAEMNNNFEDESALARCMSCYRPMLVRKKTVAKDFLPHIPHPQEVIKLFLREKTVVYKTGEVRVIGNKKFDEHASGFTNVVSVSCYMQIMFLLHEDGSVTSIYHGIRNRDYVELRNHSQPVQGEKVVYMLRASMEHILLTSCGRVHAAHLSNINDNQVLYSDPDGRYPDEVCYTQPNTVIVRFETDMVVIKQVSRVNDRLMIVLYYGVYDIGGVKLRESGVKSCGG